MHRIFPGTPSGSAAPSWPRCPPSSKCGSRSRSTTSPALPSSTESASRSSWSKKCFVELVSYLSAARVIFVSNKHCQEVQKQAWSISFHSSWSPVSLGRLFACFSHLPRRAQVTVFSLGASDSFLFVVFEPLLVLRERFLRKRTRIERS